MVSDYSINFLAHRIRHSIIGHRRLSVSSQGLTRLRYLGRLAGAFFLLCLLWGCNASPDTSYIHSVEQFGKACHYCKKCKPDDTGGGCVKEGERCEVLCPNSKVASLWMGADDKIMCRCVETNKTWVFDTKEQKASLQTQSSNGQGNSRK